MPAYYNENDPKAAAWLRELIRGGHIAPGEVDERSIEDVRPKDLSGFRQCHFFAGIGGWSYALRLAGWSDDRSVWTGSCPCQPFSAAGNRKGTDDERHLWPAFRWLIDQCRPPVIFGEQVASKDGRKWLTGVRSDLEVLGYGVGAADLCAAGVGAPHIRQRLWWVADAQRDRQHGGRDRGTAGRDESTDRGGGLGNTDSTGIGRHAGATSGEKARGDSQRVENGRVSIGVESTGTDGGLSDTISGGSAKGVPEPGERQERHAEKPVNDSGRNGIWADAAWIPCADGKARRIEPGIEPLVDGISGRVGLLRGYGNAIVPQVAQVFIEAYEDAINDT